MNQAAEINSGFDRIAAEAFAGRIMQVLDSGAVANMMAIGHRTGLFDVMAELPAATSDRIADRAT